MGDLAIALNNSYKAPGRPDPARKSATSTSSPGTARPRSASSTSRRAPPIFVEGRLQLDQWETKEGEKRSRLRVRAERIQFLGRPKEGAGGAPAAGGGEPRSGAYAPRREPSSQAPSRSSEPTQSHPPDDFHDAPSDDDVPF